ncbi:MAG TPA: hypothetical protein VFD57_06365 [Clostridia bacterium]|nr:hypothetical protein [Clostridia bacterium]
MLRYIKLASIVLTIILLFTGCQGIAHLNPSQIIVSPTNKSIPIQGTWRIYDYNRISEVQEDNENIVNSQELIGEVALFTHEWASLGDENCSPINYQIRRVDTKDYFLFNYNLDSQELEIKTPMIDIVSITSNGVLFFDIVKIAEDKAIIYIDESLYWLEKVSDEVDELYADENKTSKPQTSDKDSQEELLRSGVLLGLRSTTSSSNDEDQYGPRSVYRTIWISSHNRKVESTLESPDLFIPRRSGFWILGHRTRKIDDAIQDYMELRPIESWYRPVEDKNQEFMDLKGNIEKNILFAGDDYIAIEYSQTKGDGSKEPYRYRVLPLDDVNSKNGILISDIAGPGMEDIFYKSAQSHLTSKGIRIDGDLEQIAHEDNFTLLRRNGNWILRGRLNLKDKTEDFTLGLMPLNKLINYDELHIPWDIIKEKIPMALDAYTSPNKELLIVVTGNFIMIYTLEQGQISDKPIRKIGIKKGESVIMAEWATGDYVDRWEKSFNQLNPYIINEE